jgi:ferredoxin
MRRLTPALILVVLAAALVLNFWPKLELPGFGLDGGSRLVETKLGLDLVGGLQVEYQALPAGGKSPDAGAMATIKQIVENRVNNQGVTEPVVQTQVTDRIVVDVAACQGCGLCAAECPGGAITLECFTDEQMRAAVDGLLDTIAKTPRNFQHIMLPNRLIERNSVRDLR